MKRFLRQNYLLVLLISIYLITRLFHLTILPIFNDESIHIYWAKLIATSNQQWFISLIDGEPPLFIWLIVFFLKLSPGWYLVAGRLPSVLAGAVSLVGIYKLAELLLKSKRTGLIAAGLYIILPFAFFYDRLASYDGLFSAFGVWSIYFAVKSSKTLSVKNSLWWGFVLGLALLSKANGVIFVLLSALSFIFSINFLSLKKQFKKTLFIFITGLTLGELIHSLLFLSKGYELYSSTGISRYTLSIGELFKNPFVLFPQNIMNVFSWIATYYTWPIFILGVIGLGLLLLKNRRAGSLLFLLWLEPIILFSFVALPGSFYPRHILFVTPYFLIATAFLIEKVLKWNKILAGLVALFILIFVVGFDTALLFNPLNANFPKVDYNQYVSGTPSGYGLERIFSFLHQKSASGKITVVTLGTISSYPYAFNLEFWRNPNVRVIAIWPVSKDTKITISKLAKSSQVYVVIKSNSYQDHSNFLKELNLKEILKAEKPNSHNPILLAMPQD